ncbi:MAG: hypothetical protein KDA58_10700, partial [Planctomycetaceae bacterium]|nr:hypothetical protein [Planctomycetaceae bacterium]
PWQEPAAIVPPRDLRGLREDYDFPFHSTIATTTIANVMAGNLSVNRSFALSLGGFDENFVGAAYRFETEFSKRWRQAGGNICYCPEASINHLRIPSGGTRSKGDHRASADPRHGVGDYYYAMRHGGRVECLTYSLHRMLREVLTRFHATHPWYIPVKLVGELRAMAWARRLVHAGPKLLTMTEPVTTGESN